MSKLNYGLFDHNNFASISINPFRNKFAEVQTFFSASFRSGLEALVFYVLFPPLLFHSVYESKFNLETSARFLLRCRISCMLGAVLLSWLVNQFYKRIFLDKMVGFHCGFRFNTYIGFAICQPLLATRVLHSFPCSYFHLGSDKQHDRRYDAFLCN